MSEGVSSLEESPSDQQVDLSILSELGKNALVNSLNSVNGAKTLVLDPSLAGPLGLLTEVSLLKHHGVDKMFWLEAGPLSVTTTNIVYLCRPNIKLIKTIADQVKRLTQDSQKHTFMLMLVPRTSTLVSRILEEEGVLGDITVSSFSLQLIPLEDDVISLENDNAFKEIWVDGDETAVYDSAQALITFQKLYGLFPRILGKGDAASRLTGLLTRLLPQASTSDVPETLMAPSEKLDSLIILDRRVDMLTPLLTQLTYEGLIDELIGIRNTYVELPSSLLNQSTTAGPSAPPSTAANTSTAPAAVLAKEKKKKHRLTASTDKLFAELRDLNFSSVGKRLNRTARELDEESKHGKLQAKTVAQLRDFVGKLGGLQSLRLHTGVSEMIVPLTRTDNFNRALEIQQNLLSSYDPSAQITAIEDLMAQGADLQIVIRLLCLASLTNGGIKAKTLEGLKRDILQSYGYDRLPLLLSLSSPSLSLIVPNPIPPSFPPSVAASKIPWSSVRKALRLVADDEAGNDDSPQDISYVYSGYAPLSVRLVQCVAQKGGVLSNSATGDGRKNGKSSNPSELQVRAHPIIGWRGFEDVLASLPGDTIDVQQKGLRGNNVNGPSADATKMILQDRTSTTVVFFLGGCTYTEIAALRWVGRQSRGEKFLIATTSIISGEGIINSISGGSKGPPSKEATL
ncbi:Sec1-like protein [Rickenella mellea]|uniref:Sec1-like protein n=1 Tax=Rickenella mellea TaxID=50990 RepID=A0A4Y7QMK9_9AGAM|nr:Sec1-like protein [Rickenella mellea]